MKFNQLLTIVSLLILAIVFKQGTVQAQELNEAPQMTNQSPFNGFGTTQPTIIPVVANNCNRTTIVNNYIANFVGSECSLATLSWTGSTANCQAGTVSAASQTLTFQRINYYRNLVGLGNVTFDNTYNTQTQAATLMMSASNLLSHCIGTPDPCSGLTCYTTTGSIGAQNSNLALGAYASSAIKLYIDDPGGGNIYAGHRRWILYSRALSFGHGCNNNTDALWVFGTIATPSTLPSFIAFPSAGFFPRTLVPQRWSFGIPDADLSSATVAMFDEGNNPISITQNSVGYGFGDNTLVWDLASAPTFSGTSDVVYKVTVSGVKIGGVTQAPYTYNVVATDATTNATLSFTTTNPNCGQNMNTATITANFPKGAKSFLWSNGATTQTITGLAAGTYSVTVTDKNDCTFIRSVTISNTVSTLPAVVNNAPTPNCAGTPVTLTASNCGGTYTWTNGVGTGAIKTVMPPATANYGVSCTEGSCAASTNANTTVIVTPSPKVACVPTVTSGLSQFYGVTSFTLNGTPSINASSFSSENDTKNYIDNSCIVQSTVLPNLAYFMTVGGYNVNPHYVNVYIDYNNNGDFTDAGERVLSGTTSGSSGGNTISTFLTIPSNAVLNTLLRVRVVADPSSASNSCTLVGSGVGAGQVEDYAIKVYLCTMTTIKSGNWNDPTIWSCGRIPNNQDVVTISAGHSVVLSAGATAYAKEIKILGTFYIQHLSVSQLSSE